MSQEEQKVEENRGQENEQESVKEENDNENLEEQIEQESLLTKFRDTYLGMKSQSNIVHQIQFLLKQTTLSPIEIKKIINLDDLINQWMAIGFNFVVEEKGVKPYPPRKSKSKRLKILNSPRILRPRNRSSPYVCKRVNVKLSKVKLSPGIKKRCCGYYSPLKSVKRAKTVIMETSCRSPKST